MMNDYEAYSQYIQSGEGIAHVMEPETQAALADWYERMQANETDFEEGARETGIPLQPLRYMWLGYESSKAAIAHQKELN